MKISDEQLIQFIELYQSKYGVTLDKKTAYEKAMKVLKLVKVSMG